MVILQLNTEGGVTHIGLFALVEIIVSIVMKKNLDIGDKE